MSDFLIDMALNHFEFDETQKARIMAAIPKAAYLAHLVKQNKTVINELIDVVDMVSARIAKEEQS